MIWWQYICAFFVGLISMILIAGIPTLLYFAVKTFLEWLAKLLNLENIKELLGYFVLLIFIIGSFFVFFEVGADICKTIGWCGL